jgi:hypothetical protein
VIPPLAQILLTSFDWRVAHRLLGTGVLAALPIVMLLPLSRITAGSREWRALRQQTTDGERGPWTVSAALTTGAFRGLFTVYLCTAIAAYSILPQSVAYLVERGFAPLLAAGAFGMTGMLSVLGILGPQTVRDASAPAIDELTGKRCRNTVGQHVDRIGGRDLDSPRPSCTGSRNTANVS